MMQDMQRGLLGGESVDARPGRLELIVPASDAGGGVPGGGTEGGAARRSSGGGPPRGAGSGGIGAEAKASVLLALPMILAFLLETSLSAVALLFAGRMGKAELGGAALGNLLISCTAKALVVGGLTAQTTLSAQAFGAKRQKLLGVIFQRAVFLCFLFAAMVTVLWSFTERALLRVGQDPAVAANAHRWVMAFAPGLFPGLIFECQKRWLQAQRDSRTQLYVTIVVAAAHPALCYLAVDKLELGLEGPAYAMAASQVLLGVLMTAVILVRGLHKATWGGWTTDAFFELSAFLRLAGPGTVMVAVQWWAFEMSSLLAGSIGETELGAQAVSAQVLALAFRVPLGISVAASIRVGIFLGAGVPHKARVVAIANTVVGVAVQSVIACGLLFGRRYIAEAFTDEPDVVDEVATLMLGMGVAFYTLSDGTQGVLSGVLRGCGRQGAGGIANTCAWLFVGLPLAFYLTFGDIELGMRGIWIGLWSASFCQVVALGVLVYSTNWQQQAEQARRRVGK